MSIEFFKKKNPHPPPRYRDRGGVQNTKGGRKIVVKNLREALRKKGQTKRAVTPYQEDNSPRPTEAGKIIITCSALSFNIREE